MQLGKKVVVVTGAARGLGRAMAQSFAGRGAEIAALVLGFLVDFSVSIAMALFG